MAREENVIRYYTLCNRLKDIIRTGWSRTRIWNSNVSTSDEI